MQLRVGESGLGLVFDCPICHTTVKLVSPELTTLPDKQQLITQLLQLVTTEDDKTARIYYTPQAEASEYASATEIRQFLEEYGRRYEACDIMAFIELWADDAVQEMRSGTQWAVRRDTSRTAILRSYARLFRKMGSNSYHLVVNDIHKEDGFIKVQGLYRSEFPLNEPNPHRYEGLIELTLVQPPPPSLLKIQLLSFQPIALT